MSEYPDWWIERYCVECHRRKESCECGMTFAEKVRGVSVNYYKLKRQREGVKAHGPHTAKR